ncbi:P1 family peptidase [Pontibacillus salicampi]|uniref:P1 family peptidase n=1 Tax=Pontibacillus salicampi TaxID=1449801 RepID=A0ABV6LID2_9BACI
MRKRLRELGIVIGELPTGEQNSITDVPEVKVGHVTLSKEEACVQTGVTAIMPHGENPFYAKVPAAGFVANGFGKTAGLVQIEELGEIESPILLTNTFSVGSVLQGAMDYMLKITPEIGDTTGSINVIVGECNDSFLHDPRSQAVEPLHAAKAIEEGSTTCEEGAVGAGTGMTCFQYKGGIGTSSRIIHDRWTLGVLINSNYGLRKELEVPSYQESSMEERDLPAGSIMVIIATDAPVSDRQLKRLAKRATVGIVRTGGRIHHASGDIVIAFSNTNLRYHFQEEMLQSHSYVGDDTEAFQLLLQAVSEATEEAIMNSLTMASSTTGRKGRYVEGIPYALLD